MELLINACLEKDKVKFNLCIPPFLIEKNKKDIYLLDSKEYSFKTDDINFELLQSSILNDVSKVLDSSEKYSFSFKYFINQSYNAIENIINFLNLNKDLPITLMAVNYKELIQYLGNKKYSNIKISFTNSDNEISYKEFYDMFKNLNELVEFVKYYKLSNLEKCLLVYDIVKANKYICEDKNENYSISRDLNQIINSGKIVCVGYSNLISFLLTNLDIKNNTVTLKYQSKKSLHERNYLYLKDEKYNIDGVFFLDATWDSKKDDSYIDNYHYFMREFDYFNSNKDESIHSPEKFSLLELNEEEFAKSWQELNREEKKNRILSLNSLGMFCNQDIGIIKLYNMINNNSNDVLDIFDKTKKTYNSKISQGDFMNALYKVRRIEYINNIIKEEPDAEYIRDVANKQFSSPDERLLIAIGIKKSPQFIKTYKDIKLNSIRKDNLRLRLIKDLKEIVDDKPTNKFIKKM